MKNTQRGFIVPLLIGIIVVLLIGASVYVYENKKAEVPTSPTTETQSSSPTVQTNSSQSESVSLVSTTTWKTGDYMDYPSDVVMTPGAPDGGLRATYTFPATYFSSSSISSAKVTSFSSCGNDEPPTNIVIEGLNFYKSADSLAYILPGTCNTAFTLSIATGTPTDVDSVAYQNLKNIFYTMIDGYAKKSQTPVTTQPATSPSTSEGVSSTCPNGVMTDTLNGPVCDVSENEDAILPYTDSSFGFSFWYPNGWQVTQITVQNPNKYPGGTILKQLNVTNGQRVITIEEFTSPTFSITDSTGVGACPVCSTTN
jgi:hypothetical protein